jgi:hypothetical protein
MLTMVWVTAMVLLSACGQDLAPAGGGSRSATAVWAGGTLPPGVMSATRACTLVVGQPPSGFFAHVEQVHLVLTTYAKGEPVVADTGTLARRGRAESGGGISYGMPPGTPVWVVEVHAKAINAVESGPPGSTQPAQRYTDFSVVLNARTGEASDSGKCNCWPLPLWKAGTVVSLPARC